MFFTTERVVKDRIFIRNNISHFLSHPKSPLFPFLPFWIGRINCYLGKFAIKMLIRPFTKPGFKLIVAWSEIFESDTHGRLP